MFSLVDFCVAIVAGSVLFFSFIDFGVAIVAANYFSGEGLLSGVAV
jgi:hypothetical protein